MVGGSIPSSRTIFPASTFTGHWLIRLGDLNVKSLGWKFKPMMPGYEKAGIAKSSGMLPYFQVKSVD